MFKVDQYVAFVIAFTIPFGLVFELPVIVYLTIIGVLRHELLARNRKYALLIIVVLAAALTPNYGSGFPDDDGHTGIFIV